MSSGVDKKDFQGITIEVDGKVLGKVKEWRPSSVSSQQLKIEAVYKPSEFTKILVPKEVSEIWEQELALYNESPWVTSGSVAKVTLPERPMVVSGEGSPSFVAAQLEMWGVANGDTVPMGCLVQLVLEMERAGYDVSFDFEESPDMGYAEASGVVVQEQEFEYTDIRIPEGNRDE